MCFDAVRVAMNEECDPLCECRKHVIVIKKNICKIVYSNRKMHNFYELNITFGVGGGVCNKNFKIAWYVYFIVDGKIYKEKLINCTRQALCNFCYYLTKKERCLDSYDINHELCNHVTSINLAIVRERLNQRCI